MIRLIAFDMDGTVLDDKKKIMPKTKEILELAASKGIEIVPATGRPYCGLSKEIDSLQGVRYVLTTNGAGIYEKKTGTCIHEDSMKLSHFLPLMEKLEPLEVMADAFLKGDSFMAEKNRAMVEQMDVTEEIKEYIRSSRKCVPNLTEYLKERGDDVEKLTINFVREADGSQRDYDKVMEILRQFPEFNAVSGGMQNIEVTDGGISKATGLKWLGEYLKILPEEMIAFGDSGNDVEMLQFAGIGVAMGNAEPAAIEAADRVTKRNTEEGIWEVLKELV